MFQKFANHAIDVAVRFVCFFIYIKGNLFQNKTLCASNKSNNRKVNIGIYLVIVQNICAWNTWLSMPTFDESRSVIIWFSLSIISSLTPILHLDKRYFYECHLISVVIAQHALYYQTIGQYQEWYLKIICQHPSCTP